MIIISTINSLRTVWGLNYHPMLGVSLSIKAFLSNALHCLFLSWVCLTSVLTGFIKRSRRC